MSLPHALSALVLLVPLASSAAAQELYRIQGDTYSQLGFSASPAGDVNNDGVQDFICGRPYWQVPIGGQPSVGAQVFSGTDGTLLLSLSTTAGRGAGFAVGGVGDIDADGHDDLVVGHPTDDSSGVETGAARVYSGIDGALLFTFFGNPDSFFGGTVAGVGDVNADGVPDIAVGAQQDSTLGPYRGRMVVYSGLDGSVLMAIDGTQDNASFGNVSRAGDVNSDGYADVFVGAAGNSTYGPSAGLARVYSGLDGSVIYEFPGTPSSIFGIRVNCAGDVNADGIEDLIVGYDIGSSNSRGKARVFSGADGSTLFTVEGDTPGDAIGRAVSPAGDVNGDGFGDVIIGGSTSSYTAEWSGIARVHSGLDGSELFEWHGEAPFDMFGWSVCSVGDVNGDGLADLIVGAAGAGAADDWAGMVRVISPVIPPPSSYCFADGSSFQCPCGNNDPAAGCANSTGSGALLAGSGSQSLGAGNHVLSSSGLPPGMFALLFKGSAQVSLPFGDGRRCIGGQIRRLTIFQVDAAGNFDLAVGQGDVIHAVPGTTDNLQVWYRDLGSPCGTLFNLSNALVMPWAL